MILSVIEFDTKWSPRPVDRLLLSISVVSAVAYLVSQMEPFAGSAVVKSLLIWLWPSLGGLRLPVLAYICVITAMGVMSLLAGFPSWIVPAGALLFMLSDSLIAVGKFKHPIRYDNYLIWCTYYVGQVCIAVGFLRYRGGSDPGISTESGSDRVPVKLGDRV